MIADFPKQFNNVLAELPREDYLKRSFWNNWGLGYHFERGLML